MPDGGEGGGAPELSPARTGAGPLLQRDYWAVVDGCRLAPADVMGYVAEVFESLSPAELAAFARPPDARRLGVGDELEVRIAGAGPARVRVLHRDALSVTLATMAGHPEAGRITFGAYRNAHGDVVFHIRSRARSSSVATYLGFRGIGEGMQTATWTDFVNRVAAATGRGVLGVVHAETREIADEDDQDPRTSPTYVARDG